MRSTSLLRDSLSRIKPSATMAVTDKARALKAIVDAIAAETKRIWNLPEVVASLKKVGADSAITTPDEFTAFARAERVKWAEVVKAAGVKID